MVKRQIANSPVKGGIRKKQNRAPTVTRGGNGTIIKYNSMGNVLATGAAASTVESGRFYVPGFNGGLANSIGPSLVGYYSTGRFQPGTKIR